MHLLSGDDPKLRHAVTAPDRVKGVLMWVANRIGNYRSFGSGPRVTAETLRAGGAGLVLSVLLNPFDELDFDEPYGAPPEAGYAPGLFELIERVEEDLQGRPGLTVVRTGPELEAALERGETAMVHAVEGGFALGDTPEAVQRTVRELARRGVGYVTLAHLFFRGVATNAPALPWFSDAVYDFLFPQHGPGLTPLG
jgi:microsomal dipeptidase-like Zn-dependent dipeptidase